MRAGLRPRADPYRSPSSDDNDGGAADAADAAGWDGMEQAAMDRPAEGQVDGAPASWAPTTEEAITRCQILASRGNLSQAHTH